MTNAVKNELGHNSTYARRMVSQRGAVEAAKEMVRQPDIATLGELYRKGRERGVDGLALTVEALVLEPKFATLFPPQIRQKAWDTLHGLEFKVPPRMRDRSTT